MLCKSGRVEDYKVVFIIVFIKELKSVLAKSTMPRIGLGLAFFVVEFKVISSVVLWTNEV